MHLVSPYGIGPHSSSVAPLVRIHFSSTLRAGSNSWSNSTKLPFLTHMHTGLLRRAWLCVPPLSQALPFFLFSCPAQCVFRSQELVPSLGPWHVELSELRESWGAGVGGSHHVSCQTLLPISGPLTLGSAPHHHMLWCRFLHFLPHVSITQVLMAVSFPDPPCLGDWQVTVTWLVCNWYPWVRLPSGCPAYTGYCLRQDEAAAAPSCHCLGTRSVFYFFHFNGCEVVSESGFHVRFPDDWHWAFSNAAPFIRVWVYWSVLSILKIGLSFYWILSTVYTHWIQVCDLTFVFIFSMVSWADFTFVEV